MKGLRVTKYFNETNVDGVRGELESKKLSRDNNSQNIEDYLQFPRETVPNWENLISILISSDPKS